MPDQPEPRLVRVELGERGYDIVIGAGLIGQVATYLGPYLAQKRVFVISDETVWACHGDALRSALNAGGIDCQSYCVPAGEASKNWDQLGAVLTWLLDGGAGRDDVLMAFGGGVVGDLAGLAAALMKRGMTFVQVPTTLLAQVDSSVGGKTAINTAHGKNLVGAFYQPRLVLADTQLLATLPKREVLAGYAEVVKYGLIDAPDFLAWLEQNGRDVVALRPDAIAHAVAVSCQSKARIVAADEREGGVRALLNLGHTFGHTLEAATGYGADLLHGEAVAAGMALALRYSARLGLMEAAAANKGAQVLQASGLQTDLAKLPGGPYVSGALAEAMKQDKKVRAGKVPLILARGLGQAFIHPEADLDDVRTFLSEELGEG